MEKSTVSPEYKNKLDTLAENLMADRRQKAAEQAAQLVLFEVKTNAA